MCNYDYNYVRRKGGNYDSDGGGSSYVSDDSR